jgi:hypothetical protein
MINPKLSKTTYKLNKIKSLFPKGIIYRNRNNNLFSHGIYLSENNTYLVPKLKSFFPKAFLYTATTEKNNLVFLSKDTKTIIPKYKKLFNLKTNLIKNNTLSNGKYFLKNKMSTKVDENDKIAKKIVDELTSLETEDDIKKYYAKKNIEDFGETNFVIKKNTQEEIDNMTYINHNLLNDPKNYRLFKSFDKQIKIMGNVKYRNIILEGINNYRNNSIKFQTLNSLGLLDTKNSKDKKYSENLQKMRDDFCGLQNNRTVSTSSMEKGDKILKKRKIFGEFDFDPKFQNLKKFVYKDIHNFREYKYFGKKIKQPIRGKEKNILKSLDNDAEYVLFFNGDMNKLVKQFLSFNERGNKLNSNLKDLKRFIEQREKELAAITKRTRNISLMNH